MICEQAIVAVNSPPAVEAFLCSDTYEAGSAYGILLFMIPSSEFHLKIVIPHFVVIKREVFLLIAILRHRTHPVGMHLFIPGTPELLVHGCTGNDFEWYAYMIDFQNIQILPECFFHIIRRHFVLCLIVHVEDAYFSIQIMFTDIINA